MWEDEPISACHFISSRPQEKWTKTKAVQDQKGMRAKDGVSVKRNNDE